MAGHPSTGTSRSSWGKGQEIQDSDVRQLRIMIGGGFEGRGMRRNNSRPHTYSVGQVAKRWGISPDRVRQLIDAGKLAGTFEIPSAGRFGKALRIPAETVFVRGDGVDGPIPWNESKQTTSTVMRTCVQTFSRIGRGRTKAGSRRIGECPIRSACSPDCGCNGGCCRPTGRFSFSGLLCYRGGIRQ